MSVTVVKNYTSVITAVGTVIAPPAKATNKQSGLKNE
jgi:hypothetical protein